jgi:hypothetical protein
MEFFQTCSIGFVMSIEGLNTAGVEIAVPIQLIMKDWFHQRD